VIAVPHKEFKSDDLKKYIDMCSDKPFIFDFRNILKDVSEDVCYQTL